MTKYLLPLVLCSLVLSACGAQNTTGNTSNNSNSPKTEATESNKTGAGVAKSLRELLSSGLAQKCTWSVTGEGTQSSGEITFKGNKFVQSLTTSIDGGANTKIKVLSDGAYSYMWNPDNKQSGIKVKVEDTQGTETQNNSEANIDWDTQYNYNCSPATVSDSDFVPPSDIQFVDFSQGLNKIQEQMKNFNVNDFSGMGE